MSPFGPVLRVALLGGRGSRVRGIGTPSLRSSDGYEFSELRAYVEGDDPRRIDWAATARASALQTRLLLEERALTLAVVLDASQSMFVGRFRTNYELAGEAATAWYSAAIDDDRCARVGTRVLLLRDVRGRAGAAVCGAERDLPGTPFEGALRSALAVLPRATRLLIASDFFELEATLPLLRACAARFDLTALFVRDPWHAGLPLAGFVRLRDAETGRATMVFIDRRARERFRARVAARESEAGDILRRIGARVAVLAEDTSPETALARAFGFPWSAHHGTPAAFAG